MAEGLVALLGDARAWVLPWDNRDTGHDVGSVPLVGNGKNILEVGSAKICHEPVESGGCL